MCLIGLRTRKQVSIFLYSSLVADGNGLYKKIEKGPALVLLNICLFGIVEYVMLKNDYFLRIICQLEDKKTKEIRYYKVIL